MANSSTIEQQETQFRNYESGDRIDAVRDHYKKMRARQTVDYNLNMREKYLTFDTPMPVWDALIKLNELVDVSDPDLDLPNVQHLIQSAEAIRNDGRSDWMQLTGLIHDLGKILFVKGCDEDGTSQNEQWGMVGDVFIVGCRLPERCVYPEFNELNPDMQDERYSSKYGIYEANCGIDNCLVAWGHDEYLFQVLKNHKGNRLPEEAMIDIRYHSFYPWHQEDNYQHLADSRDAQYKAWVKDFNQYDLYSKCDEEYDLDQLRSHYQPIIDKYLGEGPVWF